MTQGFSQIYRVNYQKTFTLTVHRESLQIFLATVTLYNIKLHQMNVKVTYLTEELKSKKERIYIHISKGVIV